MTTDSIDKISAALVTHRMALIGLAALHPAAGAEIAGLISQASAIITMLGIAKRSDGEIPSELEQAAGLHLVRPANQEVH